MRAGAYGELGLMSSDVPFWAVQVEAQTHG